ncbi:MAG TPA: ribonuclease E/G, partial [Actinobacteria bacterium]|nr:ribonuclease E/G [Actinomycetota bacterium]
AKKASAKKASASAEADTSSDASAASPAIPAVLFQPPPTTAAPRTRKRTPAKADDEAVATPAPSADDDEEGDEDGPRRRRRRGGRGRRGRGAEGTDGAEGTESDEATSSSTDGADADEADGTVRRRRRRSSAETEPSPDDPPNTVVRVRTPRAKAKPKSDSDSDKGSVRIEAKRQRRREGREAGRRRPPVLTESEFLARREAVERIMVVRQVEDRTQIAVLEDGVLVEHHVTREEHGSMVGNVFLGRVQNVLPSMEAAFVDIGRGRNAVLYAGEVNWDAAGLDGQPKRIEFALKSGDPVLVQVTKDPVGQKGARLTSQISLPGRYLVYVPDGSMTGISRKLPDTERSRLKSTLKRVVPENAGVIVRTAAEGASEEELARDVERLSVQWEEVQEKAKTASPPSLLYGEPDMTVRVIRDIFNEDFKKVVISGSDAWQVVDDYVASVAPDLRDRLEKWTGSKDVWTEFRVDEQLVKALDRKVYLPSGGSLVIDRTEAMTVVDVNTGRFTGQGGNLEETVTANNLEAAEEIVRQLRLRDIGGIIVVDFIDMVLESNRDQVLRRLLECLGRDRTKHQVAEVTSLGLVQMTRKRIGQGLIEVFSTTCDHCNGRGINVSMEPIAEKRAALPPVVKHKDASKDVAKVAAASKRTASGSAGDSSDSAEAPTSDSGSVPAPVSETTSVDSPAPAEADSSAQSAPAATPVEAAPVLEASPRGRKRRVATKPAGDPSIPVT